MTTTQQNEELQLLRLMNDLVSIMEQEITVVEERLNDQLPELVSRKQRLLVDYQAEFKAATARPEWLAQLPTTQKTMLQKAGLVLQEVSERNGRIVKAAMVGTQRLLQGIMSSVRDEKCARAGYDHLVQTSGNPQTKSVLFKTTA